MFYGLTMQAQAVEMAFSVCEVLGHGQQKCAIPLLIETAQQETHLGLYRDPTEYRAGNGLCQADPIGFFDVKQRTRKSDKLALLTEFDINLDLVEHRELAYSPLLALVVCRLHYKLRPEIIPETIEGRAEYWKRFYNSELGKGTPQKYIDSANEITVDYLNWVGS